MWEWIVSGCSIGVLCVAIAALITIRRLDFVEILGETVKELASEEEFQKSLYTIGGLFGNAALAGLQLPKTGRKMKLEDVITQVIGSYLGNMLPQGIPQVAMPQQQTVPENRRVPPQV